MCCSYSVYVYIGVEEFCYDDKGAVFHREATGTLEGGISFSIGPVKVCVNHTYSSVCSEGVNELTATALCQSIIGSPYVYGAAGGSDSSINDFVYPLSPTGLTDINCTTGDMFDDCTYTKSDCSNDGGEAIITCATGKYYYIVHCVSVCLYIVPLCPDGVVRLGGMVYVNLNNGTSITIGRPEVCKYGTYVPICSDELNQLSERICNHFGTFDSKCISSLYPISVC